MTKLDDLSFIARREFILEPMPHLDNLVRVRGHAVGRSMRAHLVCPPDPHNIAGGETDHFDFRDEQVRERKLAVVEQLITVAADEGCSLIHLALGFVLAHRGVTSAIIGPRTLDQLTSQLGAGDVVLSAAALDRIDALVAPGADINPDDVGYQPPELLDPALRRR